MIPVFSFLWKHDIPQTCTHTHTYIPIQSQNALENVQSVPFSPVVKYLNSPWQLRVVAEFTFTSKPERLGCRPSLENCSNKQSWLPRQCSVNIALTNQKLHWLPLNIRLEAVIWLHGLIHSAYNKSLFSNIQQQAETLWWNSSSLCLEVKLLLLHLQSGLIEFSSIGLYCICFLLITLSSWWQSTLPTA